MISIAVLKDDFRDSLTRSAITVDSGTQTSEATSYFAFRVTESEVRIYSTSGMLFSTVPLKGQVEEFSGDGEVSFLVSASRLLKWVKAETAKAFTLHYDGKVFAVKGRGGSDLAFPVFDPMRFPWWDGAFSDLQPVSCVDCARFQAMLAHTRKTVSKEEGHRPELCAIEFVAGDHELVAVATDLLGVSFAVMKGAEGGNFRVHGKAAPKLAKFLSASDGEISIHKGSICVVYRSEDGSEIGENLHAHALPKLDVRTAFSDAPFVVKFSIKEFKRATSILSAVSTDDERGRILISEGEGPYLRISAQAATGGTTHVNLPAEAIKGGYDDLEQTDVNLSSKYLLDVLSGKGCDDVLMGIRRLGDDMGYVVFQSVEGEDEFYSVVQWLESL